MTASLMAYVPGAVVTGMSASLIVPDWANNRFYSTNNVGGAGDGISQFVGYLSGDVSLGKTIPQIGIVGISNTTMCLTYGGALVAPTTVSGNSVQMVQIRAADLTLIATFGATGASTSPSSLTRILAPSSLAPLRCGAQDWVVATPSTFNKGEVAALGMPGMACHNLGNTLETGVAALGRGAVNANSGTSYVMGRGTNVFSIYVVSVVPFQPPTLSTAVATFTPANIDATWTTFSNMSGVAYDQTDGNILIAVQTLDVVTTQSYICKLNGVTGALIWKCAAIYGGSDMAAHMRLSSIKNGRFYCYKGAGATATLTTLNTIAGTATSQVISNMALPSTSGSEDTNDSIVANAQWGEGATHPNYIGTYMGTLGNHTYNGWLRLFPNGPTLPLPPAPPPLPQSPPVVSINRSWSYTLDGHTFYVLDLGGQGTFVFDTTTQKWSQFVTGTPAVGFGLTSPQWTMQNGCMWGTRIVAGDLATSTVWEMTPGAVLDNDATQIAHVCTGAVPTRSRTYIGCEALRVSASFGFMDSTGVVAFNLRFSDDAEHSWSPYYTVSLTPGNFTDEIAWRSLGSFMSPGRVFELSDVGGLVRIDGVDVYLNNFDDAPQAAGG